MTRFPLLPTLIAASLTLPAQAQEPTPKDAFIEANLLAIFYHELGHAVIDLMEVPIFGQEEDAADVMSVLLIDWTFDEDTAQSMAYDSAFGFLSDPEGQQEVPYWDLHGPDEQRYYNHICLFYGANPDSRADLAADLGLPDERAETCPEEYDLAADSWGGVFEAMEAQKSGAPMHFTPGASPQDAQINQVIGAEIASLSQDITLPQPLEIRVDSCDEPNAFYDPSDISITICTEFVPHLESLFDTTFTGN